MSSFRNPVGPQPSGVYWRRRLILGLGVLAVIVIVILIVVNPRGSTPVNAPGTTTAPVSTSPAAVDPNAPAADCAKTDLTVTAKTNGTEYKADKNPMLSLTVKNSGDAACTLSAGSDVQVYTITSGEETIWKSTDCQKGAVAATQMVEPGDEVSTTPFSWDRTRSSKSTCDTDRPKVTAGGASYHLTVSVDGAKSDKSAQFLLY